MSDYYFQLRVIGVFFTVVAVSTINFFLFGDTSLINHCNTNTVGSPWVLCRLFQAIYGHVVGYLHLYYVIYGVLFGSFLLYFRAAWIRGFGAGNAERNNDIKLSLMPFINIIVGLTVSYVVCLLIKFGNLDIVIFDLKLSDYSQSGGIGFLLGVFIAFSVLEFLKRLMARDKSSDSKESGKADVDTAA